MGITEPNPAFVWPAGHAVPEPFARWRDELDRLAPSHYRLVVDWPSIQPQAGAPPDLDRRHDGCARSGPPCAGWSGVREQLRALAARQQAGAGAWQALVVLDGTPGWAGRELPGCRQKAGGERARALSPEGAEGLTRLVGALLAAAREEGAQLRWWSARNEPNHPSFLAPQRSSCSPRAPSLAVDPYVEMAQAVRAGLDAAPGRQELVLGELAGVDERRPRSTSVSEFAAALPRELVCAARVWSQHGYVGGTDAVDDARLALRRFGCPRRHAIWVTETGVGGTLVGRARSATGPGAMRECRALRRQLLRWHRDEHVGVAFQYTLREDEVFPTGLVDARLERPYPALREWQAWGGARRSRPTDEPPAATCR